MTVSMDIILVSNRFFNLFLLRGSSSTVRKMVSIMWAVCVFGLTPLVVNSSVNLGQILPLSTFILDIRLMIANPTLNQGEKSISLLRAHLDEIAKNLRRIETEILPDYNVTSTKREYSLPTNNDTYYMLNLLGVSTTSVETRYKELNKPFKEYCIRCVTFLEPLESGLFTIHANNIPLLMERTLAKSSFGAKLVEEMKKTYLNRCDLFSSPHEFLYDIYQQMVIVELKLFVLRTYTYSAAEIYTNKNHRDDIDNIMEELNKRIGRYIESIKFDLPSLPRTLRRCDPPQHIPGETFLEFGKNKGNEIDPKVPRTPDIGPQGLKDAKCRDWINAEIVISKREVVSSLENNMVVTGVKFNKTNSIVQIQIQTGKLIPYGKIDKNTVKWIELENLSYSKKSSEKSGKLTLSKDGVITPLDGRNITRLTEAKRTIYLDELQVPENHTVTGIQFSSFQKKAIGIRIRATPFDYETGSLGKIHESVWINSTDMRCVSNPFTWRGRVKVNQALRNPLKALNTTRANFEPNKFIQLEKTDSRDGEPIVIPLLDALEVSSASAVPLAGINLFHKAAEGYGGFLSLQIITIDRTKSMSSETFDK